MSLQDIPYLLFSFFKVLAYRFRAYFLIDLQDEAL
jgi:hypothetical protein